MLDLNTFDTVSMHEQGFKVELNLPNGEPAFLDHDAKKPKKRLAIIIKGAKCYSARNDMLRVFRDAKKAQDGEIEETFEEMVDKAANKMASVTIGWENIPSWDGNGLLEFSKDDAFKLYKNYESIREQVIKAHENEENFIKA